MLNVPLTVSSARAVRRLAVKHSLYYDPKIDDFLKTIPRVKNIEGFNFKLKDYQADAVAWLESQDGCGLLADEPGLGKTAEVIAYAHKNQRFPMLVVCPNTLKLNWRNEVLAMTGQRYKINVVGKSYSKHQQQLRANRHPNVVYSKTPIIGCDVYIVNYDILATNIKAFELLNLCYMAVDESHKIKNPEAKRTKAMLRLAIGEWDEKTGRGQYTRIKVGNGIRRATLMSGTPQINKPLDLWTSVQTVAPWVPEFSKFTKFAFRYCDAKPSIHGWNFSGASNTAELHTLLTKHAMLRRLKTDVLKDLPPKIFKVIPLDFDRREYDKVELAFKGINWHDGIETLVRLGSNVPASNNTIVAIQTLREIAGYAKLGSAIEWIKDYTEEGRKVVVFAHNRGVIEQVKTELEKDDVYRNKVQVIIGGTSDDDKDKTVQAFQTDKDVRVIIVSMTAGGFGFTLTAADSVAFLQLPWSPADVQQCADRVHRVGQLSDSVTVHVLTAEGTIEDYIAEAVMAKALTMDGVLDGGRTVNTVDLRSTTI